MGSGSRSWLGSGQVRGVIRVRSGQGHDGRYRSSQFHAEFPEFYLKGLTQLRKSRRIYPKYMPKCSVGSTDHVCKFLLKKLRNVEDVDV